MDTVLWSAAGIAGLIALIWLLLLVRIARFAGSMEPLSAYDGPLPSDAPWIEAIVPARNEEAHVAGTIRGLLAQTYPNLRVTVVDDLSTDRTGVILDELAATAEAAGKLRVIHGVERPAGWVGKTWALQQGIERLESDWIWFVDADMEMDRQILATAWHEAQRTGADLVTFAPQARCETFWQAVTGIMLTQLLTHLYPTRHVNDPKHPGALAVGGFILIRRAVYERAGGHAAVRGEIVEDIALARRVKGSGGRIALRGAPGLLYTHMYGSLRDIFRGLRKNAYAGMEYQFHKYAFGALIALVMAWVPPVALVAGLVLLFIQSPAPAAAVPLAIAGAAGWVLQALSSLPFAVFLNVPWIIAFGLPAGVTLYVAIATASVRDYHRGRVVWKDRNLATHVPAPADPRV